MSKDHNILSDFASTLGGIAALRMRNLKAARTRASLWTLGLGIAAISFGGCSSDPINPETKPGGGTNPQTEVTLKSINLAGEKLGIIGYNNADTTFEFRKSSAKGLEIWTVSASKKAIGGRVNLESPILNPENLIAITSEVGGVRDVTMPYSAMGVKISAEGSNSSIAESSVIDNTKYKVKTASYVDNAGLLTKNVHSLEQLKNVLGNKSLEWKLLSNPASDLKNLEAAPKATFNVKVDLN